MYLTKEEQKMLKKNLFILNYTLIFVCYVLGSAVMVSFSTSYVVSQVVLKTIGAIITLTSVFYLQVKSQKSYSKLPMSIINIGFIFVFFGDFFLAFANLSLDFKSIFFPFGMASYLIGYSLFGISFIFLSKVTLKLKHLFVVIPVAILTYLYYCILEIPQELKIPLLGYCFMMITILFASILLLKSNTQGSVFFSIAGFLYYASDIIVGFNEFGFGGSEVLLEYALIIPYVLGHIFMLLGIKKYTLDTLLNSFKA